MFKRLWLWIIGALVLCAPAFIPILPFLLRLIITLLLWLGWTSSFNTISGYTSYCSFGHTMFIGIGAYTLAVTLRMGLHWGICLILLCAVAAVAAFVIGFPTLSLHGAYFAIATWILAEVLREAVTIADFTGGAYGINVIILPQNICYLLAVTWASATVVVNYLLEKSKIGYALRALASSEFAAETTGVNTLKFKLIAFIISGILAGIGGGIYAVWVGYVCPGDAFNMVRSMMIIAMLFIGEPGYYLGPVVGVPILLIMSEIFWMYIPECLYLVFVGLVLVLSVLLFPKGLLPVLRSKLKFNIH